MVVGSGVETLHKSQVYEVWDTTAKLSKPELLTDVQEICCFGKHPAHTQDSKRKSPLEVWVPRLIAHSDQPLKLLL